MVVAGRWEGRRHLARLHPRREHLFYRQLHDCLGAAHFQPRGKAVAANANAAIARATAMREGRPHHGTP